MKRYKFTSAKQLISFMTKIENDIKREKLIDIYLNNTVMTDQPIVIVFEKTSIIIEYYWLSNIEITVVETDDFYNDTTLNFIYTDIPESKNITHSVQKIENKSYVDIFLKMIVVKNDLPKADCFSDVTFYLSNESNFSLCGGSKDDDGYMYIFL
jgi:hypothetical protein